MWRFLRFVRFVYLLKVGVLRSNEAEKSVDSMHGLVLLEIYSVESTARCQLFSHRCFSPSDIGALAATDALVEAQTPVKATGNEGHSVMTRPLPSTHTADRGGLCRMLSPESPSHDS